MNTIGYTAVIRRDGPWRIGPIEEDAGVNSQRATKEELIANLREALSEAMDHGCELVREERGHS